MNGALAVAAGRTPRMHDVHGTEWLIPCEMVEEAL
jgi:hypothetical protein